MGGKIGLSLKKEACLCGSPPLSRNPFIMTKLFVYGVNANCPKEKLEKEFSGLGEVTDCFITGKGYAFVTMANHEDAERAIEKLHGAEVDGQEIKVEEAVEEEDVEIEVEDVEDLVAATEPATIATRR